MSVSKYNINLLMKFLIIVKNCEVQRLQGEYNISAKTAKILRLKHKDLYDNIKESYQKKIAAPVTRHASRVTIKKGEQK